MKMTNKSKILALVLCAVLLVGGSVMATMAYLMDSEEVVNTFTVGKVYIDLDEAKVTPDGVPVDGTTRVEDGNEYHLVPGQSYYKDPTVTVTEGSETSYVRMIMTLQNHSAVQAIVDKHLAGDYTNLLTGWDASKWIYEGFEVGTDNTISFEFRYFTTVGTMDPKEDLKLDPLFTGIKVPDTANGDEIAALTMEKNAAGEWVAMNDPEGTKVFKMIVQGHAIQAAGFDNAEDAWEAFDVQYAEENK